MRKMKIRCNKCGKIIQMANGYEREGVCHIETRWGYFSDKDGEIHKFNLCESCYDEWIAQFAISVEIEEQLEF